MRDRVLINLFSTIILLLRIMHCFRILTMDIVGMMSIEIMLRVLETIFVHSIVRPCIAILAACIRRLAAASLFLTA